MGKKGKKRRKSRGSRCQIRTYSMSEQPKTRKLILEQIDRQTRREREEAKKKITNKNQDHVKRTVSGKEKIKIRVFDKYTQPLFYITHVFSQKVST